MGLSLRAPRLPASRAGRALVAGLVLLVAAGVGVGTALGGPVVLGALSESANPVRTSPPPGPIDPRPSLRGVATDAPVPAPPQLAAVLDNLVASPVLGQVGGAVVDPVTGTPLWTADPDRLFVPGSTAKLMTAAAALLALDPELRLETRVVAGAEPGTIVLVGGGDPTISSRPAAAGAPVYPDAARLDDLVAQVKASAEGPISKVLVDVDRYSGEAMGPAWLPADIANGFIAPIVPVMLDGGRIDPTATARSSTPALAAAAELARRLGADPAATAVGKIPEQAVLLGVVRSAPIRDLVTFTLRTSDNVLAEILAHEMARAADRPANFANGARTTRDTLVDNGIDPGDLRLADGSGLSAQNQVTARGLAAVLAAATAPGSIDARTTKLRPLLDGLPVAGGSGTLDDRYTGSAAGGRGYIRAKTGTLDGVNSLAGVVLDVDGRLLVFAFLSNGSASASARPALDAVAAALRGCGCR